MLDVYTKYLQAHLYDVDGFVCERAYCVPCVTVSGFWFNLSPFDCCCMVAMNINFRIVYDLASVKPERVDEKEMR